MTRHTTVRRTSVPVVLAVTSALVLSACGGGDDEAADDPAGGGSLEVLIASSGEAETAAVEAAAQEWSTESGTDVSVRTAQDITQELAQGFAGGNPPDVFYVDAGAFADLASAGNLYPYADQISDYEDFYEPLRETFTLEGEAYCVPKDFSTLALQINTAAWEAAGLTDADIPTTWDELAQRAQQLTTGDQVGLVLGATRDRLGAFMVQAGGWIVSEDGTEVTADSPENVAALEYVDQLLESGSAAFFTQLDAGWGGEAFGTQRAAMAIEGNWIRGAMENDYPDVAYTVAELPEGPAGQGTLQFTQCWGIAADSEAQEEAVALVEHLTTAEQQLEFADAYGVMPSRQSAEADYVAAFPDDAPFIAGGTYGQGPVNVPGIASVLTDFDAQLETLPGAEPAQVLGQLQTNAEAVVGS